MIEKNNKKIEVGTRKIRRGTTTTNKVKQIRNVPLYVTNGNVTMATNGATYRFPNPYGAKQITFFGIASRLTTAGYTLTVNPVARIPSAGDIYENTADPSIKIVITGNTGATTIFALPDGTQTTIPTGRYDRVSGTGNSFITVTAVSSPGVDIRADLFGIAHLRPGYYFQPQTSTEVTLEQPYVANTPENEYLKIVQAGKWFLVVDENASGVTPEYRARSTETRLINIDWPNSSTIVARATVVRYNADYFEVEVQLATNWIIVGNFMCT